MSWHSVVYDFAIKAVNVDGPVRILEVDPRLWTGESWPDFIWPRFTVRYRPFDYERDG